jgi:CPA2 family monovalent cation:H+ antiporter-2
MHIPVLISDLTLILGIAGVVTLFFKKIKQPVVLGYILSGLLVGPNLQFFPSVVDIGNIKIWGELGVIFLLFALGLEFSFKKVLDLGAAPVITGIIELLAMMGLGIGLGILLGWSRMDAIFLGGIIAISSTTIIFRAFDELGLKTKSFTKMVLGVLIIEDLFAVLLMVMLSTMAVSQQIEGWELIMSLSKLVFFLLAWFLTGIFVLPTLFKRTNQHLNSETLMVVSIALCFAMVVAASSLGFSPALGAFAMGSLLAETVFAEKIESTIKPVKNLFGAIFFVSVGMLIEPTILVNYGWEVVILTLAVVLGKTLFITLGSLISGKPLHQSLEAGTSMAQIGEFSFIIATLGLTLNVISPQLYPIAVGVSVITTFLTPYMMKTPDTIFYVLEKWLPDSWNARLENYAAGSQHIGAESKWKKVVKFYTQVISINLAVIIAIMLLMYFVVMPNVPKLFLILQEFTGINKTIYTWLNSDVIGQIIAFIGFIMMMPFLWALVAKQMRNYSGAALWMNEEYSRGPLFMLELLRVLVALVVIFIYLSFVYYNLWSLIFTMGVALILVFVFRNRLQLFYGKLELHFLQNLNEKEILEQQKRRSHLSPWDGHLATYTIPVNAPCLGKTLEQLSWRETYGVNVAYIERGTRLIFPPSKDQVIYPYDLLGIIGTDVQLKRFIENLHQSNLDSELNNFEHRKLSPEKEEIDLQKFIVSPKNELRGQTIRDSKIRERTEGLVVGIERGNERILNPASDLEFQCDDVVWIVGNKSKINSF